MTGREKSASFSRATWPTVPACMKDMGSFLTVAPIFGAVSAAGEALASRFPHRSGDNDERSDAVGGD